MAQGWSLCFASKKKIKNKKAMEISPDGVQFRELVMEGWSTRGMSSISDAMEAFKHEKTAEL